MSISRLAVSSLLAVAMACSALAVAIRLVDMRSPSAAVGLAAAAPETPVVDTAAVRETSVQPPVVQSTPATGAAPLPTQAPLPGTSVGALSSGVAGTQLTDASAMSAALLAAMDGARGDAGLDALTRDPVLDGVALARAENLVANHYFDHFAPDGESAFSELAARGIGYHLAGENLARNNYPDGQTVQAAFDALMASPGHRANILEPRFGRAGVAAVQADGMWLYVTVFMD